MEDNYKNDTVLEISDQEEGVADIEEQKELNEQTPSPHSTEDTKDSLESLQEQIKELRDIVNKSFQGVIQLFENRLSYDAGKDEQIRSLHAELQTYKIGLLDKALEPYIRSIIRMHDNINRALEHLSVNKQQADSSLDHNNYIHIIEGFKDELELILSQNGIEPFEHPVDIFESRCQHALKRKETDDVKLNGTVAKRIRCGFRKDEKIIQKERVQIYTYTPTEKDMS